MGIKSQIIAVLASLSITIAAHASRALTPEDWYRFQALSDLQIAPDGATIAYLVTSYDKPSDESRSALWVAPWAGGEGVQITRGESVNEPRFSPDGRYISFLTARPSDGPTQLWILDRRGGEARQLSHTGQEIVAYEWSPDGTHVVLVAHPATHNDPDEARKDGKQVKPLVIDSFQFKQDKDGYLTSDMHTHLLLLDAKSGVTQPLASDAARIDSGAVFSPDSRQIAYVSHPISRPGELGRDYIYLLDASAAAAPRVLFSTESPNKQKLEWSPDGKLIAFMRGDQTQYSAYIADRLVVADAKSGKIRMLTGSLDRAVSASKFASDSRSILIAVEDDGFQYPARVNLDDDSITRLADRMVVHDLTTAADHIAVLSSSDQAPTEAFALEAGQLRPLSAHNRELFSEIQLGTVEDIAFKSRDGAEIHGQWVKPPGFVTGRRYPTIVWIHGGPNGQDDHSLELWGYGPPLERQVFATHGDRKSVV